MPPNPKSMVATLHLPKRATNYLWCLVSTLATLAHAEGSESQPVIYAEDIKAAMHAHLSETIEDDGLFFINDEVKSEALTLRFVQIHDPVREMQNRVFFACTDFHVDGEEKKLYDIDFWLKEDGQGELKVFRTKIHKEPRRSLLYGWYKHPRYTFVNDDIQYLYTE